VLKFFVALVRVVTGFVLASIAAGLVMVLFVDTPARVLAQPASQLSEIASQTALLALLTATHDAVFAGAFVLIAAALGESFSLRSPAFYLVVGVAIAVLGLTAQAASEVAGQPTILNTYAVSAFLAAGLVGGFVYWLASGRYAGRKPA
jgi:hypothetical protein